MDETQQARIVRVVAYRDDMRQYARLLAMGAEDEPGDAVRERVLQGAGVMQNLHRRVRGVIVKPQPYNRGEGTDIWTLALYRSPGYNQAQFARAVADELTIVIGQLEADPSLLDAPKPTEPKPVPPPGSGQTINIHNGTVNIAQTFSGDVTQTNAAAVDLAEVRRLLSELTAAIAELDAPEDERASFAAPVDTLRAELHQPKPLAGRMLTAYGAITAFATAESAWQGWERVQRISGVLAPRLHNLIQTVTQ